MCVPKWLWQVAVALMCYIMDSLIGVYIHSITCLYEYMYDHNYIYTYVLKKQLITNVNANLRISRHTGYIHMYILSCVLKEIILLFISRDGDIES